MRDEGRDEGWIYCGGCDELSCKLSEDEEWRVESGGWEAGILAWGHLPGYFKRLGSRYIYICLIHNLRQVPPI